MRKKTSRKKSERKWMQGAVRKPGALRNAAHRAGESTMTYAREHEHDSGKTGKRARLALTFAKFRKGKSRGKKRG